MSLVRGPRRRCASRLRRRYGCFRLPHVPGAKIVKEAKRNNVSWLARTDPKAKVVEFSHAYDRLTADGKRYIALHEQAHLKTGPDHNASFYAELQKLVAKAKVPWKIAYELESYNCHSTH